MPIPKDPVTEPDREKSDDSNLENETERRSEEDSRASHGSERVKLTPEALDKMMPPGEYVHTFMQCGFALIGADWKRDEILKAAANGAELSGEAATRMKHGAVVWNGDKQPVFVATIEAPNEKLKNAGPRTPDVRES